jgi:hypothetical protein
MAFRTVLLAMGTGQDDAELDRAIGICDALGAHLNVLVLGVAPPPPASPYGIVSNDIWAGEIREGQEAPRRGPRQVKARLAESGISASVESQYVDRGTISTLAARSARYADLTLIAPQGEGFDRCRPGC